MLRLIDDYVSLNPMCSMCDLVKDKIYEVEEIDNDVLHNMTAEHVAIGGNALFNRLIDPAFRSAVARKDALGNLVYSSASDVVLMLREIAEKFTRRSLVNLSDYLRCGNANDGDIKFLDLSYGGYGYMSMSVVCDTMVRLSIPVIVGVIDTARIGYTRSSFDIYYYTVNRPGFGHMSIFYVVKSHGACVAKNAVLVRRSDSYSLVASASMLDAVSSSNEGVSVNNSLFSRRLFVNYIAAQRERDCSDIDDSRYCMLYFFNSMQHVVTFDLDATYVSYEKSLEDTLKSLFPVRRRVRSIIDDFFSRLERDFVDYTYDSYHAITTVDDKIKAIYLWVMKVIKRNDTGDVRLFVELINVVSHLLQSYATSVRSYDDGYFSFVDIIFNIIKTYTADIISISSTHGSGSLIYVRHNHMLNSITMCLRQMVIQSSYMSYINGDKQYLSVFGYYGKYYDYDVTMFVTKLFSEIDTIGDFKHGCCYLSAVVKAERLSVLKMMSFAECVTRDNNFLFSTISKSKLVSRVDVLLFGHGYVHLSDSVNASDKSMVSGDFFKRLDTYFTANTYLSMSQLTVSRMTRLQRLLYDKCEKFYIVRRVATIGSKSVWARFLSYLMDIRHNYVDVFKELMMIRGPFDIIKYLTDKLKYLWNSVYRSFVNCIVSWFRYNVDCGIDDVDKLADIMKKYYTEKIVDDDYIVDCNSAIVRYKPAMMVPKHEISNSHACMFVSMARANVPVIAIRHAVKALGIDGRYGCSLVSAVSILSYLGYNYKINFHNESIISAMKGYDGMSRFVEIHIYSGHALPETMIRGRVSKASVFETCYHTINSVANVNDLVVSGLIEKYNLKVSCKSAVYSLPVLIPSMHGLRNITGVFTPYRYVAYFLVKLEQIIMFLAKILALIHSIYVAIAATMYLVKFSVSVMLFGKIYISTAMLVACV